jgi:hypothetical protein
VLCAVLMIGLVSGPATGSDGMNPDVDKIMKSMSSFLGGTKAMSMKADIDFEVVTQSGQKLQLASSATIVMERPAKIFITRKGMLAETEFVYDGKTLTQYGRRINAYCRIAVPGTIDDAIMAYEMETGIPAPGADLLFSDPYAVLMPGVKSSDYIGTAYVDGVECHHLAFRNEIVDWQLWVKTGDQPHNFLVFYDRS